MNNQELRHEIGTGLSRSTAWETVRNLHLGLSHQVERKACSTRPLTIAPTISRCREGTVRRLHSVFSARLAERPLRTYISPASAELVVALGGTGIDSREDQ